MLLSNLRIIIINHDDNDENYCSSDLWSGQKDSGVETGGFHFHGQAIVEVVMMMMMVMVADKMHNDDLS